MPGIDAIIGEVVRGVVEGLAFGAVVVAATIAAIAFWGLVFVLGVWWAGRRAT